MKVLHINCNYLTTVLHQTMIEHLNQTGVESVVFAPTYDETKAVITPNNQVVVRSCFRKSDRYFFQYKQLKIRRALLKAVNVKEFDCTHAYTVFTDGNVAYELFKKYHIPYVVAVRSTDVNVFFKKMPHLRKRGVQILKNAAAVFFLSEPYRKHVLERYIPVEMRLEIEQKSHIISNGIDDFWLENSYRKDVQESLDRFKQKKLRIIFAGRIAGVKNPLMTQAAIRILQENGWQVEFTAVGKIENQSLYEELIQDSNTQYISAKPKEELIGLYRRNDVFVMPSRAETFGLVYAEALTQGLPVLYTANQGFDGQFPEGTVGYSVDARNPEDIAKKILAVVERYEEISMNCESNAKKFCWADICKQYKMLYREIVTSVNP